MMDSGIERDSIHYNICEDEGYNCPIMCVLSPREPGKTTSIMLDRVYADFRKKGYARSGCPQRQATSAYIQALRDEPCSVLGS